MFVALIQKIARMLQTPLKWIGFNISTTMQCIIHYTLTLSDLDIQMRLYVGDCLNPKSVQGITVFINRIETLEPWIQN